jgi:serine/threonine protein kinase
VEFEHGIGSAVNRLRQALGDSAENPRFIETLARRGYRWKTAVQWVDAAPVRAAGSEPSGIQDLISKRIGHYRVLEVLGGGGMGLLYKAEDIKLGRRVALKFLPEELCADPVALERFRREARAASASDHPNICTIYEVGEYEGAPYIAMQLLQGQTLSERIEAAGPSSPMPLLELVRLAIQVSDGLDAAHRQGIIHRDIKPANIFVTSRGDAKILDFGLAKLAESEEPAETPVSSQASDSNAPPTDLALTRAGAALGTAAYMSPEQVRGEKLDARTDLFSFGLVLYEMATGQRVFADNSGSEVPDTVLRQIPAPVRTLNPSVPERLEAIINRALQKDRELRYRSASELRTDLQHLLDAAPQPSAAHPISSLTARVPRTFLFVAGAVAVLLIVAGVWVSHRSASPTRELKLTQLTRNSSELPVRSSAISPDGKYLAYTDRDGIHVKGLSTNEILTLPEPDSIRHQTVHWLISSWFPDSTRFVAQIAPLDEGGSEGWSTWVASALGGAPRKIHEDSVAESISPDGSLIAMTAKLGQPGGREIWLMDAAGENSRKLFDTDPQSWMRFVRWSPDGKRLAYVHVTEVPGKDWTLESRDLTGGPPIAILAHANAVSHDYAWLPSGDLVYGMEERGGNGCNFWKLHVDKQSGRPSGEPQKITNWAGFCLDSTSVTADGKRLVFTEPNEQQAISVADVQDSGAHITTPKRLSLIEGSNIPAGWTNDSQSVIFVSHGAGTHGLYKQKLDSEVVETILPSLGPSWGASITPDGKWVLYIAESSTQNPSDRMVMRVSTDGGNAQPVLSGRFWDISCARTPDTFCLLAEDSSNSGQLLLSAVDPLKGRLREFARVDAAHIALSPDGTCVALFDGQNPIRIRSLSDGSVRDVALPDWSSTENVSWAADGQGLYISSSTKTGAVLLYSDLSGRANVLWEQRGGLAARGIPSPDGRHLAIEEWSLGSNVWMMENF